MPQEIYRQARFTGGELDPKCIGRRDLAAYGLSLAACENMLPIPQGPIIRRPGLAHVDRIRNCLVLVPATGATISTPNGGSGAGVIDGTGFASTTPLQTTTPYVIAEFDFGVDTEIGMVDLINFALFEAGDPTPADPPPQYPWDPPSGLTP